MSSSLQDFAPSREITIMTLYSLLLHLFILIGPFAAGAIVIVNEQHPLPKTGNSIWNTQDDVQKAYDMFDRLLLDDQTNVRYYTVGSRMPKSSLLVSLYHQNSC